MTTKTIEQQEQQLVTDLSKSVQQLQCSISSILVIQKAAYIQAPPVTVLLLQTKECLDNAKALQKLCIRQVNALFDIYDSVDLEVRVMLDTAYFKSPALLALNRLGTVLASIETILVLFSAPIAEDRQPMPYGSHLRTGMEYDVLKALIAQAEAVDINIEINIILAKRGFNTADGKTSLPTNDHPGETL